MLLFCFCFCFKGNGPRCNACFVADAARQSSGARAVMRWQGTRRRAWFVQNAFLPVVAALEAVRLLDRRGASLATCNRKKFC